MKGAVKCVHFCGIQKPCDAGIDPKTVRDSSRPGPYRWPCLTLPGEKPATTECASFRAQTAEEIAEEQAAIDAAIAQVVKREKSGECIHCGKPITRRRQVDKCMYADPCGHRQGQGRA